MNLRKLWKVIWVSFTVLISVIVVILIVSLRVVDKTPYFQTEYYNETISSLNGAFQNITEASGQFESGFGVVNITPTITNGEEKPLEGLFNAVPMAGFGDREGPATGAHDSLFVKAVALKVQDKMVVTISADLLLIPPFVADSVAIFLENELGITREQLFFGATHTHSSIGASTPGWVGEKFSGTFNPDIISFLSHRFKDAVLLAVADLKPSTFGSKAIKIPELVRNRMNGKDGRLNDTFTSLSFEQTEGRKAVVGTYAAHSTTLGGSNLQFSGDYPGYWQRRIENGYADVAIYFAGTYGSHSHRGEGKGFEKPKHMGETLAGKLLESNSCWHKTDSTTLSSFSIPLKISKMQFRVTKNLYLAPFISDILIPKSENLYLQGMKLGNTVWLAVPLELSGEIAIDVINALKLEGFNSIFTSFNGAYVGYVTPHRYYYDKTYESFLMGWYGPSMGDYITDLLFRACNGLTGRRL
jgi:hypothetical protein